MRRLLRFLCVALALALGAGSSFGLSDALKAILFARGGCAGGVATISYVDAGTAAVGSTSVAPTYQTTTAGNMLLLMVASRGSTDPTPTTPSGYTSVGTYNGGAGAYGLDSGNGRVTVFWREATGSESGTITVTITDGATARGQIFQFSKSCGTWATPVVDGGADSTGGTSWSVTGAAAYALAVEDMIFAGSCENTDIYSSASHALSATSITFGAMTEMDDAGGGIDPDLRMVAATATVTAGSATSVITYTATKSGSATDVPAGASAIVRLRATL